MALRPKSNPRIDPALVGLAGGPPDPSASLYDPRALLPQTGPTRGPAAVGPLRPLGPAEPPPLPLMDILNANPTGVEPPPPGPSIRERIRAILERVKETGQRAVAPITPTGPGTPAGPDSINPNQQRQFEEIERQRRKGE
jgi:hypothetical protein